MKDSKPKDIFAGIAAQRPVHRDGLLVEPHPPRLPRLFLPAARSRSAAAFKPTPRIDSAEKLQRELERQRKQHARFLLNLAPTLKSARITNRLDEFDWRLQTEGDRRDFAATISGAGLWQRVRVPHYGGPVGRATAYYRTTFPVTRAMWDKGALFVRFKGVDYKAHGFVNGTYLGSHEGFFAPFDFEFTSVAREGDNVLLLAVENDGPCMAEEVGGKLIEGDKIYAASGPGWNDPQLGWHHCPPGMGVYQDVLVEARAPIHIRDLWVRPIPEEKRAEAWIEIGNCTREARTIHFLISVLGQNFSETVCCDRSFDTPQSPGPGVNCYRFSFDLPRFRPWDPRTPWLYQLQLKLNDARGGLLDTAARQFGMRSFRMDTGHKPYGRLLLNGREIKLRGANTMGFEQQDVMKRDLDQLRDDILLAKICGMNFWRLTQRPVQEEVYEMCDRLGLMTQTDLPLFGVLRRNQFCEAIRQAEEMERLVRPHPCNIIVSYINEPFPLAKRQAANGAHRHLTRVELESFFRAADEVVRFANPDRVIKPVDGDYDPPAAGLPDNHCYSAWYNGHGLELGKLHKGYWQPVKPNWVYGCGEFGAEGLDPVDLMRRRYPKEWLPQSADEEKTWSPGKIVMAQTGSIGRLWTEKQRSLPAWVRASQEHQAWATRIMTEAFRRDNRMISFAIHLFIDAFPAGWMKAIMDCERRPKPAFFTYREALTPLMANIRTDRFTFTGGEPMQFEFWVCNDTHDIPKHARLRYQLEIETVEDSGRYSTIFAQEITARIRECASTFQGFLKLRAPRVTQRTKAQLRLALAERSGRLIHDTAIDLELSPAQPALASSIAVLGNGTGNAARLARELGSRRGVRPELYLVEDFAAFSKRRRAIDAAVERGAVVVFIELPPGEYAIGGTKLKIEPCSMGPRHFVSRATGHPLVADFEPADFRFWYDASSDRVRPLLDSIVTASDWTPILLVDRCDDGNAPAGTFAVAELSRGRGVYRVCQLTLAGRTINPVARRFASRLLSL